MSFTKTIEWASNRVKNVEQAIEGTKRAMLTPEIMGRQSAMDAHESHLRSLSRSLIEARQTVATF